MDKFTYHSLTSYYHHVRSKIVPEKGCEHLFFLTTNGSRYRQVHRKITEGMKATGVKDVDLPTPSEFRIVVGTKSISEPSMNDTDYRVVAKHLGHSTATQQWYYEYTTCNSALKAHSKIRGAG